MARGTGSWGWKYCHANSQAAHSSLRMPVAPRRAGDSSWARIEEAWWSIQVSDAVVARATISAAGSSMQSTTATASPGDTGGMVQSSL